MPVRKIVTLFSALLTLAALLFIVKLSLRYGTEVLSAFSFHNHLPVFLGGTLIYGGTGFLLAISWHRLLRLFGDTGVPLRSSFSIYARSLIAKYIPGNVFQFAARHISGRSHGIGHGPLAGSAMYEIAGVAWGAAVLAVAGFLTYRITHPLLSLPLIALACVGLLLFPAALNTFAKKIGFLKKIAIPSTSASFLLARIIPIYLTYILFFAINGGVFVLVANSASNSSAFTNGGLLLSVYAISWLAGFLTPGAPGGIGVREAAMVLLLSPVMPQSQILFAAIFFRLVNIAGDILLFLISIPVRRKAE